MVRGDAQTEFINSESYFMPVSGFYNLLYLVHLLIMGDRNENTIGTGLMMVRVSKTTVIWKVFNQNFLKQFFSFVTVSCPLLSFNNPVVCEHWQKNYKEIIVLL